jgi:phosphate starvation-inducible protein PhoH and related proteins
MEDYKIINLPTPNSAMRLAGAKEENLKYISNLTGAKLVLRGQELLISGSDTAVNNCKELIYGLKPLWSNDRLIANVDILAAQQAIEENLSSEWSDRPTIIRNRRGDFIQPRTFKQRQYVQYMETHDLIFGIGPAGTGKTYLAAVTAVKALQSNQFERLILTRPAVEAGEKLGFLPGDLQQKISPYLRPLYDALHELIDPDKIPAMMERGIIELAPLAYMRGRTLNNAFIIVDEAQNTSPAQMKMVLTRLGFNSRMVVTGDITQIDLPSHQYSGLVNVRNILDGVEGVAFTYFNKDDVVRHPLVQKIVAAYESVENKN